VTTWAEQVRRGAPGGSLSGVWKKGLVHLGMRLRLWATVGVIVGLVVMAEIWGWRNFWRVVERAWPEGQRPPEVEQAIQDNQWLFYMVLGATLILATVVALGVTQFLIRPVRKLERGVRRFAEGDLQHRIEVDTGDEIERLADVFNEMADRIQTKQRELEEAAIRDQLTGLFNRRQLMEALEGEVARSQRSSEPFAVAILDIDHFKTYNDRNGHLLGDECLQLLAKILQASTRRADTVARYGGEEFVVVLPGVGQGGALEAAERIRQGVQGFQFQGEEGQPGRDVTVSIGVALFGPDGRTVDALLQAADRRLYAAKGAGRNRVVDADAPA